MRNRGVEIYMLGPREKLEQDAIDLESLLLNAGITKPARRDALLAIYDRMSQEMVTVDHLSAIDLLHTAFLARQRSLRGFPPERSIRDACIDVYVKARPPRDLRHRQHLISLIDEAIEQLLRSRDQEISPIDVEAATWSVRNLQDNSPLTVIRQQGLLLNAAVRMCRSRLSATSTDGDCVAIKSSNVFRGLHEDGKLLNVDVNDILPDLLLNFYEQSSRDDVPLRQDWVSKMLRENRSPELLELEKENASMAKEVASFGFRSANMSGLLPWDQWWLLGKAADDENAVNDASKLALLLHTSRTTVFGRNRRNDEMLKSNDMISVRQYSDFVRHGTYSIALCLISMARERESSFIYLFTMYV